MNLNEYLMSFRDEEGFGPPDEKGYKSTFPLAKRITCADGFSLSVQATHGAYCSPRRNVGPWYEVEVGFPSAEPEFIMEHADDKDKPTDTVYGYVPIEKVQALIDLHGGMKLEAA
jgi:hypothetical protein